ncbi:MAG: hypothetical protein ABH860_01540 [bacterium]
MKRSMLLVSVFVLMLTASCFAIGSGIGVRAMGMGGTGIATANDITAAYFNPAGLMYGPEYFELQIAAGYAPQGLTDIQDMASSTTNFIQDTYAKDLSLDTSFALGLGLSVRKIGLSGWGTGAVSMSHTANTFTYSSYLTGLGYAPLTLGSTFATPGIPIASMSVGVNLKAISVLNATASVAQTSPTTGAGSMTLSSGSGFGFDIGAQTKITPFINLGAVIRNLSASANILTKTTNVTVAPDPADPTKAVVTDGAETETKSTYTPPVEIGIGVGVVVPIIGTLIAVDLENYSLPENNNQNKSTTYTDTHIGIEQGILADILKLRAGYYTYGPTSDAFYTCGLGLNLGPLSIGAAVANSTKDASDSLVSAQLGMAF